MVITKDRKLGGSNNRNYFFTVLEAGKPKIKVPVDLVPRESSLPGLQMAFSLWPHIAREGEAGRRGGEGEGEGEGEREPSGVSSYKDTNPFMRAPPS